jgi:hypothetical protein
MNLCQKRLLDVSKTSSTYVSWWTMGRGERIGVAARNVGILRAEWPMADGFVILEMQTKVISERVELARSSAIDVMI